MTTLPVPSGVRSPYLDGAWHRLHPATPLLRGGIGLVAVLIYVANTFRDRLTSVFTDVPGEPSDPIDELARHGLLPLAGGIGLGVLVVFLGLFAVSWRFHEFRVDLDSVIVKRGVLFRSVRTARLDRIQGVTISRPLLARLLGAARIELDVAGQNASVRLEYLSGAAAEALRRDVLVLAAGIRRTEHGEDAEAADPDAPERPGVPILAIGPARAIGSVLLSESTVVILVVLAVVTPFSIVLGGGLGAAFPVVSFLLGSVTVAGRRIARNLRFTLVATEDGVRVGAGLLSTSNEAVPPGRIHAVSIDQPLLWRPAGWWRVSVNRAGRIGGRRNAELERSLAPVASLTEVRALLPHLMPTLAERPDLLEAGLTGDGGEAEFVTAPRRARWLRPIAWRRTGFALGPGVLLLRRGWFRRQLVVVPIARMQSVSVQQGPAERLLGVAEVEAHVVAGPVRTRIHLVDRTRAEQLFLELADLGRHARASDRSHRWRAQVAVGASPAEPFDVGRPVGDGDGAQRAAAAG